MVAQDRPGFIVNRVARPFYGEALRLAGEGAAYEDIDAALRAAGFRMGPFELLDLIGLDVNLAATKSVYEAFFHEPRYRPHPLQSSLVTAGRLGKKSGRGFYGYDAAGRREQVAEHAALGGTFRAAQARADAAGEPADRPRVAVLGEGSAARVLRAFLQRSAPGALLSEEEGSAAELLFDARLSLDEKASSATEAGYRLALCWSHSASVLAGAASEDRPGSAPSSMPASSGALASVTGCGPWPRSTVVEPGT